MRKLVAIILIVLFCVPLSFGQGIVEEPNKNKITSAQRQFFKGLSGKLRVFDLDKNAVPSWLAGDLGTATGTPEEAAIAAMRRLAPAFRMTANDSFQPRKSSTDELNQVHVRLTQRYSNLRVVGSELIVHLERDKVIGVNGRFIPDINLSPRPALTAEASLGVARQALSPSLPTELSSPELVVFVANDAVPQLAWSQKVSYTDAYNYHRDVIFADARTGALIGSHPLVKTSKYRQLYDGDQVCLQYLSDLPGTFLWQEGQSILSLDQAAKGAHTGTGKTYDFYKHLFNRDSFDKMGGHLKSTVHVRFGSACDPNNAAWIDDLEQMVYGDGDGVDFGLLSTSLDVTAHELTHGVTAKEANLVYEKESGALNEATSDILGESTSAYFRGYPDWKVGDDVYTPGTLGDALRYMNDPTLDNYSVDYYPELKGGAACSPTNSNDHCYVHGNSGIANLAFYLMSVGGTHPQNKTAVVVPAIGIEQARDIWYKALKDYMVPSTNFAGARKQTARAAGVLYNSCKPFGQAMVAAVNQAWDAVGVPNTAQNGWAFMGLSGEPPSDISPCVFPKPPTNLFKNSGFESGLAVWLASRGVITNSASQPASSGSWKAWLGGDGLSRTEYVKQQVTIPSVTTTATLSFWLHIDTTETTTVSSNDTLAVKILDSSDNVLATLATYSNLDHNIGYLKKTFDLSPYQGQIIRVQFISKENSTKKTSFVIDQTSLTVQ